ncbi:OadG family transporter subunit [Phascolarctobacterium faecium]|uniref:OadG family transporter subunit n=1 Tax=Phascolarctobacterium faecium TaxID=33025 RepID=UPI003AB34166
MGPVTTNPWLISIINMTIVFGVLAALGVLMKIIQLVDPTQKKTANPVAAPAPAAAPAAVAAPVQDDSEVIAVIAAAVAALGHSAEQIACVRRLPEASWTQNAHIEAISVRKECF